jgi:hypothetical protein
MTANRIPQNVSELAGGVDQNSKRSDVEQCPKRNDIFDLG